MLLPEGRVIMVSGANRGIGLAVARCLYAKGYRLSLGGRDAGKLAAALGDLDKERVITCAFDARDRTSCASWVERTAGTFGRIDGLVNNAGYAMSKFAVIALTHSVRRLGWDDGVRATAVCPSFVATDMTAHVTAVPRGEMIQPGDLAELIAT